MIAYTVANVPKWNPINVCSYHLQEAGATPVQEVAFALCTAIAVLDSVRDSGQVPPEKFGEVVARISFFVNAGVRFVEEMCKLRAFGAAVGRDHPRALRRRGPEAPPVPLRRAGQLARPDRGAAGEQRLPHPARDARGHDVARTPARAPCSCRRGTRRSACRGRGTSSGRCACSRCSPSSPTCSSTTTCSRARRSSRPRSAEIKARRARRDRAHPRDGRRGRGGRVRLPQVGAGVARWRCAGAAMESGEDVVVGVNKYTETEPNPLRRRRGRRHPHRRPGGRGGGQAGDRARGAPGATRPRSTTR